MSERHGEGNDDNETSPASTVLRGRRARARAESDGDSGQPAVPRRRVEETRRPQWGLFSWVEDVLLGGKARGNYMKLNDFLRGHIGPSAVVDERYNVTMEVFLVEPRNYVQDQKLLEEIFNLSEYQVLQEMRGLRRDTYNVSQMGVRSLRQWRDFERKDMVSPLARRELDAALRGVLKEEKIQMSEGFYDSLYNARWHHVVEFTDGEGMGMEVREGKPPQSWTYKAVGRTLERDDSVEQSGAPRLRLMVLTSDKAWPYSWPLGPSIRDCYVNCEVDRVWQTVKGDLTEWFSTRGENNFTPGRRVLIGMPGIGKSMGAGSYLLYQLLHYDAEKLPVVAYSVAEQTFLFDKITKTALHYVGESTFLKAVEEFSGRGMRGYFIHNVAEPIHEPSVRLLPRGWCMIVVAPPEESARRGCKKQLRGRRIIMSCPQESDVKAMCVWKKRDQSAEAQVEYWQEVRGYMDGMGSILRDLFSERDTNARLSAAREPWNGLPHQMLMNALA
ncbi:putative retrotransposon hot spot protein (RHS) [Trypanosoma cruzi]|uniref:Putative retrotransposon hot spot protein (RHS) n=6 Tax=Trypanosoma cruzi TaxID=5693 RepID=A0A2V2WH00_TRYCR|nr:putative retrotransposon hot spot protein (RHS) [Trypanosoma cruzi]PWV07600.1 putative retrotransposon hot spot protein (RHS) [Trypanosoma cruzi]PWV07601.1 putative retrotransposon hot spot protein (RHS) [Trypanosoma cruzi]PWV07602.1 putative retrotransposon hot spot protein (RHS) [Trypanosoma cruzi]PWV07605.1 putative retrotransposon hot spot protein (RHS) [Trypanosoma cruzi]